jgi:uncharacterized protein YcbX
VTAVGVIDALYRYPVKSMQGERVRAVDVTELGVVGDRAYALVDETTGRIASAHRPDIWGLLLQCSARWEQDVVVVTLPGGVTLPIGGELEQRLTALLHGPVRFIRQATNDAEYDFEVADVPDHAPADFVHRMLARADPGSRIGRLRVALDAPSGTLVDVAPVHVITTGSLAALARSGGDADIRRFRPNVVINNGARARFTEAEFDRCDLRLGDVRLHLTMPTMRCLMTTLEQRDVIRHRDTLRALARDNRLRVGKGQWACLGHYASVTSGGRVHVGDAVDATRTETAGAQNQAADA